MFVVTLLVAQLQIEQWLKYKQYYNTGHTTLLQIFKNVGWASWHRQWMMACA